MKTLRILTIIFLAVIISSSCANNNSQNDEQIRISDEEKTEMAEEFFSVHEKFIQKSITRTDLVENIDTEFSATFSENKSLLICKTRFLLTGNMEFHCITFSREKGMSLSLDLQKKGDKKIIWGPVTQINSLKELKKALKPFYREIIIYQNSPVRDIPNGKDIEMRAIT
jgi:hypothetical protein